MQQRQWTKTIKKELKSSMASLSNWSIASAPIIACLLTSHDMRIIKLVSVIHQVFCYLQPSTIIIDTMISIMRYFEVVTVRLLPVRYIQHQFYWKYSVHYLLGFPDGIVVKNLPANEGNTGVIRKIPWRRKWQPTSLFLPGKSHGQKSSADYSPWGCKRIGHNFATKQFYLLSIDIIFINAKYFSNFVSCFPSLTSPFFSVHERTENDESNVGKRESIR